MSSGISTLFTFLKNRYKSVLMVTATMVTVSLVLSLRNAKRIKKMEKSMRELAEKHLSKDELEFECQKLVQRTVSNQSFTVVNHPHIKCLSHSAYFSFHRDPYSII